MPFEKLIRYLIYNIFHINYNGAATQLQLDLSAI